MTRETTPWEGLDPAAVWVFGVAAAASGRSALPARPPAVEWDRALGFAGRHRLTPLLYWALRRGGFPDVPTGVKERLEGVYRTTVGTNLAFARVVVSVLDVLEGQGVGVMALKGPVAAYGLHGNLAARRFGDLDLLVRRGQVGEAIQALGTMGFAPAYPLHPRKLRVLARNRRELPLTHAAGWIVDLHWEAVGPWLAWCREEALWDRSVVLDFEGRPVRTLGAADMAMYYCLKVMEDGWYLGYQLLDAVRALQALAPEGWDEVVALAEGSGKWRTVAANLVLAEPLLAGAVPERVAERVQGSREARRLAAEAARRLVNPPPGSLTFFDVARHELGCLPRWRDRVRLAGTLVFHAGQRDLAVLPAWLCFPPVLQAARLSRVAKNLVATACGRGVRVDRAREP